MTQQGQLISESPLIFEPWPLTIMFSDNKYSGESKEEEEDDKCEETMDRLGVAKLLEEVCTLSSDL